MKRFFLLLLAMAMVMSLTACGESSSGEIQNSSKVTTGEVETTDDASGSENQQAGESAVAEVTIEETVLLDESGIKITAKSLETDEFLGAGLKLLIENNSGKDLTVQCRNASVNGYMVDPMMSTDVVNGKKANDTLTFMDSDLEACGITSIADMEFSFHIFTTDGWDTYLDSAQIQLKTSAADTYEYAFDDSGNITYDADGIKLVVKGLAEDESIFGSSVVVYIENNREEGFTVQTRDASVNGFMVDTIFSSEVMPGKRAVDTITFMDSDLEGNGITAIEDIELSFHIFNTDSWDTIVDTDAVSITF